MVRAYVSLIILFFLFLPSGKERNYKMKIEDVVRSWFISIEEDDEVPEGFEVITEEEMIKALIEAEDKKNETPN